MLKFEIDKPALDVALDRVSGVIERGHTSLPVLSHVLLSLDGEQLHVTGSNLETEITARLPCPTKAPGSACLPAKKLISIIKSAPDEPPLKFSQSDTTRMSIHTDQSKYHLATLPGVEYPLLSQPDGEGVELRLPADQLRRLIRKTAFAMARNDVRFYLNGLHLHVDGRQLQATATDGHRLARWALTLDTPASATVEMILPGQAALNLARILGGTDSIALRIGRTLAQLDTADLTLTTKLVDGRYPDADRVIPRDSLHQIDIPRLEALRGIEQAGILSNDEYRGVQIRLEHDVCDFTAKNQLDENAESRIYLNGAIKTEVIIGMNIKYLSDALSALETETVNMRLTDGNSSIVLTGDDDEVYVVMPMRM